MNKYESVIIINPSVDEEQVKALTTKFTDMINKDGNVEKADNLGKEISLPCKEKCRRILCSIILYSKPKHNSRVRKKLQNY